MKTLKIGIASYKRRVLTLALGVGLTYYARLPGAQTVAGGMRRVGVFAPATRASDEDLMKFFYDEMRQLGWIEGQNIEYDRVYGADRTELMPQLAAQLVARKPDLILAVGPPASSAAKQASASIPIIFTVVVDPVVAGLVASLARPGGNVTGITQSIAESLMPKRIQLLREFLPGVTRIGLLGNTLDPGSMADQAVLAPLIAPLGLTMVVANGTNPAAFDASVASLIEQRVQAIVVANGIAVTRRVRMIELSNHARIPVAGFNGLFADAGALFSYGPSITDQIRRSAHLVDKVLRGAKPADIPVEAANLIELVVNVKSARTLGIKIPQSVLLRADRVIE